MNGVGTMQRGGETQTNLGKPSMRAWNVLLTAVTLMCIWSGVGAQYRDYTDKYKEVYAASEATVVDALYVSAVVPCPNSLLAST